MPGLRGGLLLTLILLGQAGGTIVMEFDFLALHERAGRLFHGQCIERREIVEGAPCPCTEYTFEVIEAIKGCRDTTGEAVKKIRFRHVGTQKGYLRPDGLKVPPLRLGLPEYKPGDETVLFLTRDSRAGFCSPVGLSQGHFRIHREKGRGRVLVKNPLENKGLFQNVTAKAFLDLGKKATAALEQKQGSLELEGFLELCRKVKTKR